MQNNWSNATITDVRLAVCVTPETGGAVHKNRPSHGFAINDAVSNKKIYFSDGTVLTWGPYDLVYFPKGSSYHVKSITSGCCWAINFDLMDNFSEKPFKISFRSSAPIVEIFKDATNLWIKKPEFFNTAIKKHLYDIILKIHKEQQRSYMPSEKEKLIQPAVDIIRSNYTKNDLTSHDLSSVCHISEPYLRRIFKEIYSVSPKEYMINLRIEHAKTLLSSHHFSVSEVATLCGYAEPCHFSREFSKHVGCSPKSYKLNY